MSVVRWADKARDELADIYVQATPHERDFIESVVLALERDLSDQPQHVGESRVGQLRFELRRPIAFWFSVAPFGDSVRIVRVTRPRRM
jgi:plasmid stabilization system protein ParE